MFPAVITLTLLALLIGLTLLYLGQRLAADENSLVEQVNELLPQTQCAQCGFPGCRPYAQAIVDGEAPINQCPPGGDGLVKQLSELLDTPPLDLDPARGTHKPPMRALIDEDRCIGCTLCIRACPVDAIVGAQRQMHTVIADECTGCELCIEPCPVDCISMLEIERPNRWPAPASATTTARTPVSQHG